MLYFRPGSIVLKPGPARRVDPGPGRPGPGTGPGLSKNQLGPAKPGRPGGSTQNPAETRLPSFFCIQVAVGRNRKDIISKQKRKG